MNKQTLWKSVGLLIALWPLLFALFMPTQAAGVNATALLAGNTVTLDTVIATAGSGGKFSLLLDDTDVYANCNGHCHCDIDEHHDTNRHRHGDA